MNNTSVSRCDSCEPRKKFNVYEKEKKKKRKQFSFCSSRPTEKLPDAKVSFFFFFFGINSWKLISSSKKPSNRNFKNLLRRILNFFLYQFFISCSLLSSNESNKLKKEKKNDFQTRNFPWLATSYNKINISMASLKRRIDIN